MADTDIVPGIFEKEWDALLSKVRLAAPVAHTLHIYVSDGSLGTPETWTEASRFKEVAEQFPDVTFEAHILSANPEKYVRPLADNGFRRIIAHVESNDPRRFLEAAKYDDVEVGIAIDGATEVEQIEPFLEEIDVAVVMTAEAGVIGGTFLPEAIEKIKLIHQNFPDLPIEAVGGITDRSVKAVKDAGAARVVASQYIFASGNSVEDAIAELERV